MRKMAHRAFFYLFLMTLAASVTLSSLASCYYPAFYEDAYSSPYAPDILLYPPTITFYLKDSDVPFYYQGPPYYHYYPYYPYYPPAYGNPFYRSYH